MSKRFIIAGGGTGGHIFPAIAIANAIKKAKPGAEILFVGAKGKMEMEKVPLAGYKIEGLTIAGFNRSSLIKNIGLPFKLIQSFFQVASIIKKFKPDAVIGVGCQRALIDGIGIACHVLARRARQRAAIGGGEGRADESGNNDVRRHGFSPGKQVPRPPRLSWRPRGW